MLWRKGRPLNAPAAFIHPCQTIAKELPSRPGWANVFYAVLSRVLMAFKIFRILVSALPLFYILVFGTEADECQLAVETHNKYIMGTVKPTSEIIARALAAVVMEATKMADVTNAQWPEWIKGCNRLERETCRNPWFYLEKKALPTNGLTCAPTSEERGAAAP